jgi:hypothetical protein
MLFCNIFFPPNTGAGYFPPQFVSAGILFVQNSLAGNFLQNHTPLPPSKVKWSAPYRVVNEICTVFHFFALYFEKKALLLTNQN